MAEIYSKDEAEFLPGVVVLCASHDVEQKDKFSQLRN
jgi:hypothetical protein